MRMKAFGSLMTVLVLVGGMIQPQAILASDFGKLIEKLLISQSEKLFGVERPL